MYQIKAVIDFHRIIDIYDNPALIIPMKRVIAGLCGKENLTGGKSSIIDAIEEAIKLKDCINSLNAVRECPIIVEYVYIYKDEDVHDKCINIKGYGIMPILISNKNVEDNKMIIDKYNVIPINPKHFLGYIIIPEHVKIQPHEIGDRFACYGANPSIMICETSHNIKEYSKIVGRTPLHILSKPHGDKIRYTTVWESRSSCLNSALGSIPTSKIAIITLPRATIVNDCLSKRDAKVLMRTFEHSIEGEGIALSYEFWMGGINTRCNKGADSVITDDEINIYILKIKPIEEETEIPVPVPFMTDEVLIPSHIDENMSKITELENEINMIKSNISNFKNTEITIASVLGRLLDAEDIINIINRKMDELSDEISRNNFKTIELETKIMEFTQPVNRIDDWINHL